MFNVSSRGSSLWLRATTDSLVSLFFEQTVVTRECPCVMPNQLSLDSGCSLTALLCLSQMPEKFRQFTDAIVVISGGTEVWSRRTNKGAISWFWQTRTNWFLLNQVQWKHGDVMLENDYHVVSLLRIQKQQEEEKQERVRLMRYN